MSLEPPTVPASERPIEASGPPVTVVVATRDRPAMLQQTLSAVASSIRASDHLIVVDSASSDSAVRDVAEAAGALVARCERPGTCRARNVGWRMAETEIVVFTDDDCLPGPGWVSSLGSAFGVPTAPGFVTGRVLPDTHEAGRARLTLSVTDTEAPDVFASENDPDRMGHGANMAWRRTVLEDIGGFDEMLGPGAPLRAAEDHDAFWRALRAGHTGRFEPNAVVLHRQWRSRRAGLRTFYAYGVGSGALAVKRWKTRATGEDVLGSSPSHVVRNGIREELWEHGLVNIGRTIASRHEMGALAEVLKLGGCVRGMLEARRMPLVDGHFKPPD